jgi:hypothetical protein
MVIDHLIAEKRCVQHVPNPYCSLLYSRTQAKPALTLVNNGLRIIAINDRQAA